MKISPIFLEALRDIQAAWAHRVLAAKVPIPPVREDTESPDKAETWPEGPHHE